jgi:hypothetical protein
MRETRRSGWMNRLAFAAIAIAIFVLGTSAQAYAQSFKPGDRIEVDPSGIQDWMKGTVLPFQEKDEPKFKGEYYLVRVLIDKWKASYPEGVLVQLIHARPLAAEAAEPRAKPAGADRNPPGQTGTTQNQAVAPRNQTGAKFKPGDRVECDAAGIDSWLKGTVLPFQAKDAPEAEKDRSGKYFYIHRVRLDREAALRPEGGMCFTDRTRLLTGAAAVPPAVDTSVGKVTVDADNTLSADRPVLECPVSQPGAKNGSRPDPELLKKIFRCDKGEARASKGSEGAVTVDVTALQIAAPRPWVYANDVGGVPGTTIYPVRFTYTVRTFYRTRTVVAENWVRTVNFYVNAFGEWQSGSEEPIKSPPSREIPRLP